MVLFAWNILYLILDRAKLTGNTQPLLMSRLFVYIHMNRVVDRNTRKCSNPFLHGCSIPARIPVYLDYSSFSSEIAAALAQGQGGWRVPNLERTGFAPPPPCPRPCLQATFPYPLPASFSYLSSSTIKRTLALLIPRPPPWSQLLSITLRRSGGAP